MKSSEGEVPVETRRPEEKSDFGKDPGLFVAAAGLVVPGDQEVGIHGREQRRGVRRGPAELAALRARHGVRGGEAEQQGAEEVRHQNGARQRVDEVRRGVLGGAKGAVGQDVRAVLEVQQLGRLALELGVEDLVARGEGAERREAGQDEVVGRGGVGARNGEEVLGAEQGEGGHGEEEGGEGEDDEGGEGARSEGDDGFALVVLLLGGCVLVAQGSVEGYCFGEEHGAEEDEEGLDTVGFDE